MSAMNDFKEIFLKGIDELKQNLWITEGYSRVALFIGAGFSRNAETNSGHPLPDWNGLKNIFISELCQNDKNLFKGNFQNKDCLIIASEYEAVLGYDELKKSIERVILSESPKTSVLHKKLLQLPWSDVFTTNYDDLLEDADETGIYSFVTNQDQISELLHPMIVKLHGSICKTEKYIITEEEYRTYPQKYPVFLNTVRQTLLENSLLLIGFSGSDPNFKRWIGWIRDNTGSNRKKIYLYGALGYSKHDYKYYSKLGITPLDFCSLEDTSIKNHSLATEYLIHELANSAPKSVHEYPMEGTPQILLPPPSGELEAMSQRFHVDEQQTTNYPKLRLHGDAINRLMKQRINYPGWILPPSHNRRRMVNWSEWTVISEIMSSIEKSDIRIKIKILNELWFKHIVNYAPLYPQVASKTFEVLNEWKEVVESNHGNGSVYGDFDEIETIWLSLVIQLVEWAAVFSDIDLYNNALSLIDIHTLDMVTRSRMSYASCLLSISQLNIESLTTCLSAWKAEESIPLHLALQARLLKDLGHSDEAVSLAEKALYQLAKEIPTRSSGIEKRSTRAWLQLLMNSLVDNSSRNPAEYKINYDPWIELQNLNNSLKGSRPLQKEDVSYSNDSYDSNVVTTYSLGVQFPYNEYYPAFCAAQMLLHLPIPIRHMPKAFSQAAIWLGLLYPKLSITLQILTGDESSIEQWMDSVAVLSFNESVLEELYAQSYQCVQWFVSSESANLGIHQSEKTLQYRSFITSLDILGRIAFRMSKEQIINLFTLAFKLYSTTPFSGSYPLFTHLEKMFTKLKVSISRETLTSILEDIACLPLAPAENCRNGHLENYYPEPFNSIEPELLMTISRQQISGFERSVKYLIEKLEHGSDYEKGRAEYRLGKLSLAKFLLKTELDEIQKILSKIKCSECNVYSGYSCKFNFSSEWEYCKNYSGTEIKAYNLLRRGWKFWLEKGREGRMSTSYIGAGIHYINEIMSVSDLPYFRGDSISIKVAWTTHEKSILLGQVLDWWERIQEEYKTLSEDLFKSKVISAVDSIIYFLADFILPCWKDLSPETSEKVISLYRAFKKLDINMLDLEPFTVILFDESINRIVLNISQGLLSLDRRVVAKALSAILIWKIYGTLGTLPPAPECLVIRLASKIEYGSSNSKLECLKELLLLLKYSHENLGVAELEAIGNVCGSLFYQTTPKSIDEMIRFGYSNHSINRQEFLQIRLMVSKLALLFLKKEKNNEKNLYNSVKIWVNQVTNERIPIVRENWIEVQKALNEETSNESRE